MNERQIRTHFEDFLGCVYCSMTSRPLKSQDMNQSKMKFVRLVPKRLYLKQIIEQIAAVRFKARFMFEPSERGRAIFILPCILSGQKETTVEGKKIPFKPEKIPFKPNLLTPLSPHDIFLTEYINRQGVEGDMDEEKDIIRCLCPLFACRVCRTKTGWRHQSWCERADVTEPGCAECHYYDADCDRCRHPAEERRRRVHEGNNAPFRA